MDGAARLSERLTFAVLAGTDAIAGLTTPLAICALGAHRLLIQVSELTAIVAESKRVF